MEKNHYHLIGICGTAMASLAGMLVEQGHTVTGSDENIYPPMSLELQRLGIPVREGYAPENLQERPEVVDDVLKEIEHRKVLVFSQGDENGNPPRAR